MVGSSLPSPRARVRHAATAAWMAVIALLAPVGEASEAHAASTPLKPHAQLVQEVVSFLLSDVGNGGIRTMDGLPQGAPVPPYFYHYAIQHDDDLPSATTGYPGYASISYPGYTVSVAIDAFLAWWGYSGDPQALARARALADWVIARRTPPQDLYGNCPYSTQTDGVMGGGFDGDAIMTDKPGMIALRCLRLADITGDPSYLDAARQIADTYMATQLGGDATQDGRWPFRVRPTDGMVRQDYTSHLIPAIRLLKQMEQRVPGAGYGAAADRAWAWLWANPLNPVSPSYQRWEGFYEDSVPLAQIGKRDHYSAEETVQALLDRAQSGDLDKAVEVMAWSTARYMSPNGFQDGYGMYAPSILEWDLWPNTTYAATGQWAYTSLRLEEATRGTPLHDPTWRAQAVLALHTITYGQGAQASPADGRMLTTIRELTQPLFGTETWYEQNFNTVKYLLWSFALAPELAPAAEDHLLGFRGGELAGIGYGASQIATSWAAGGRATFKLRARPAGIQFGGTWQLTPVTDLAGLEAAWTWDASTQVCTVQHQAGEVLVALAGATAVNGAVPLGASAGKARARLLAPYPAPANPRVRVPFELSVAARVGLAVYDARGRLVARLLDAELPAGTAEALWDGRDAQGRPAASGVYTVRLTVLGLVDHRSVVLAR